MNKKYQLEKLENGIISMKFDFDSLQNILIDKLIRKNKSSYQTDQELEYEVNEDLNKIADKLIKSLSEHNE